MSVLGVVGGPGALLLDGRTLTQWATATLQASGLVIDVVVLETVQLPAGADHDRLLLHDPRYALVGQPVLEAVLTALDGDEAAVAAVPVRPVTDTLKRVDDDGVVRETLDRNDFRVVLAPVAVRAAALRELAAHDRGGAVADPDGGHGDGWEPLVARLAATGRVVSVEVASDAFPITDAASLALAEAVTAARSPRLPGGARRPGDRPRR